MQKETQRILIVNVKENDKRIRTKKLPKKI